MKEEAERNEAADKAEKEQIDKINQADLFIFKVEKELKELGDKVEEADKKQIESALADLKKAHATKDIEAIDRALEPLNLIWEEVKVRAYQKSQATQKPSDPTMEQKNGNEDSGNVTDAEFEEVK